MNASSSKTLVLFFALITFAVLPSAQSEAAQVDGKEFMARADRLMRGDSSILTVDFLVKSPSWERTYRLEAYFRGLDYSFVRTLSPAKYRNQNFLRLQLKMWQYLPRAERDVFIPPSMMLDQFLGSDFTNDDFVKASYYARDYDQKVLDAEVIDGYDAYVIENLPKPEAPVTYGKIIAWLRKSDAAPVKEEYYNDRGELIKVQHFKEFRRFGNREIPSLWHMVNHKKEGRETIIKVLEARYDMPIPDEVFTREHLVKERSSP